MLNTNIRISKSTLKYLQRYKKRLQKQLKRPVISYDTIIRELVGEKL